MINMEINTNKYNSNSSRETNTMSEPLKGSFNELGRFHYLGTITEENGKIEKERNEIIGKCGNYATQ